ncbi:hypothetical protein A3C09_04755 [Candidatus Uhrbacteria bacterium RIFCSPHIGHO2_02_FULL_47_44]|uniref:Uncharacterized protein n=1 Tax=Candidatus Uhrbacteria bacterium RIFCSPLOWO2_02_FULL_48_18 TaxID=1802408 RepID=A0A1F7VCU6_9BACT|nr:MAG: hypothetical protein A2839_00970 [Candidatus Uhrbacteria bacterium RIFCSPHIGHO2_01_FULL_47_10]OGL71939.1 MAG: hypothetical protein A3C09_04755 [Candidatus Uhrbacteria bacterium RIFCSPHIGHO2_02_FULL_47_44]OGL76809.1 MAG: hypothetical protein A3E97_04515 [Candidatus Uhrbacteria bacterium RIFCSPHIGHO2_12_FULL_47_12]OGL80564.1 MAG: hypothetical protein A3B20_04150 [Candidatus Uhrbacteria bacterium RIFCSPLOWO2_01_FULL_47_17]OGL88253.1 MAG: hypothetical protein A3I41_00830 [Candidatus Uhrbact
MEETTTKKIMLAFEKQEQTTNQLMEYMIGMDQKMNIFESKFEQLDKKIDQKIDALDKKFETKFDLLFDAVGDLNEKFTIMDYKFLQLKRQMHAT